MQLDDHLKRLLRELGHAINDSVSESDRITEAIAGVRAAGYDIVLKLDATIGLARRESHPERITSNDRQFLESLHIQVDQEVLEEDERHEDKGGDYPAGCSFPQVFEDFARRAALTRIRCGARHPLAPPDSCCKKVRDGSPPCRRRPLL